MNKRSRIALWHGLILFNLLVLAASPSKGANFVWTNTAGGAWVVPSNWSPNQVPSSTDNAFITNNGTYMVTLSSNATAVAGLTIGGGSGVQTLSAGIGTFTINAILTLSGSGTLAGSGAVTVTGTLNWMGGTMSGSGTTIIANGGTLSLNTTTHALSRVLQNDGTATWTAGAVAMNGGTFNNNGSFTGNSATGLNCYGNGGVNAFNNAGTLTKQGAGLMRFYLNVNNGVSFNNSGTVDVQQGALSFLTGGTNSGSILLAAGTTLDLSASYSHAGTSSISGPGTLNLTGGTQTFAAGAQVSVGLLDVSNGTVSFMGALSLANVAFSGGTLTDAGDVTITGTLDWSGGTMSGGGKTIIANGSTLSLNTTTHGLNRVLQNDGTATWTAGAVAMNGGTFNNNGSFTGNSATGLSCYGNGGVNAFNNAGTLTKQGAGLMRFYLNVNNGVSFNNSGTVDVQDGTLTFNAGFAQTSGQTILRGGSVSSSSTMQFQGGSLGGVGTIDASVTSSGVVSPGVTQGQLTITGNYSQTTNGVLEIEVGGSALGSNFDQLVVTGAATLDGILNIRLVNGFSPGLSNTFAVMTYGSHAGTFAALTGDGPVFQPQYDPLALVLTATSSLAACATVPAGLVSWWPMNGNVSDMADANNPSATNALSFTAGRVGQGVKLGAGGFIEIPQSTNLALQAFTIDAWVRPDGPGPNNDAAGSVIFQKNINVPTGIQSSVELVWRATDNRFLFDIYGVGVLSSQAHAPGQFYHVAGTHDGTTLRLFVDGVLSAEQTRSGAIVYDASVPYTIGANFSGFRANGFPRTWNGVIDEVHVFNRALTSNEVAAIHSADNAGFCPPPAITAQPASVTGPAGGNYIFTVIADGADPLTYQWRKNGLNLPGETSATLTINNAQVSDVGRYSVRVSNANGAVTSLPAELAVLDSYSLDLPAGFSLIANQLYQSNNLVSTVFPNMPNGTTVYKWNGAIQSFNVETFIAGVGWQPGTTTLAPGEGAFINLPTPQTLVFTGAFRPPTLPISLFAGYNLVSLQIPRPGTFEEITGRSAEEGVVVDRFRPVTDDYRTYVYLGGEWRDRVPVARVGEAVWVSQITRPIITGQPAPRTNATPGSTIDFAVAVSGTPPLRYQWQRNGVSIPDATNASYTINNAQILDSGIYTVAVQPGRVAPPTPQPGELEDLPGVVMSARAALRFVTTDFPFSDDFAARPVVNTNAATFTGNNFAASREPGEPRHAGKPGRHSVWLAWMAPANGIVTFISLGSSFDTLLAAYTGNGFPGTEVESDDDGGPFLSSRITFNATAGQIYNIAVDGFGRGAGDFILSWNLEATAERVPVILTQPQNQVTSLNSAAQFTVEAAGPNLAYQWFLDGQAVSGATSSNLVINPVRADDVGVYVVRVNSGSRFVLSHPVQLQIGAVQTLLLAGNPKEGEDELLAVDKFQDIVFAATNTALVGLPGKAVRKVVAHGFSGTQIFSSVGSTKEADEPNHCGVRGGKSEWFSYQPTNSGALLVDTDGSNFDTVLAIYVGPGDDFLTLTNVACDNNGGTNGKTSSVFFNVTSNTIYYIAIDGVNNPVTGVAYSGRIHLNYRLVLPIVLTSLSYSPSNDNGRVIFKVAGTPGVPATVQSARSLSSPDWISLFTNTTANGSFNYTNTNALTFTNRFYRAINEF